MDKLSEVTRYVYPGSFMTKCDDKSGYANPYVFPPFSLIGPLMKFLLSFKIPFTTVVPEFVPHRYWWVELNARCSGKICLGTQGDLSVLLSPSKSGYSPTPCPFSLWAFRVSRF